MFTSNAFGVSNSLCWGLMDDILGDISLSRKLWEDIRELPHMVCSTTSADWDRYALAIYILPLAHLLRRFCKDPATMVKRWSYHRTPRHGSPGESCLGYAVLHTLLGFTRFSPTVGITHTPYMLHCSDWCFSVQEHPWLLTKQQFKGVDPVEDCFWGTFLTRNIQKHEVPHRPWPSSLTSILFEVWLNLSTRPSIWGSYTQLQSCFTCSSL